MKRILSLFIALTLLTGAVGAVGEQDVKAPATLSNTLEVRFEGEIFTMYDATGSIVYPLLRNGTTYLPVRALSEKFQKTIAWDAENYAVRISDVVPTPTEQQQTANGAINYPHTVEATESKRLVVYYNDKAVSFKDVTGTTVYPLLYKGTTYLPVRALADLFSVPIVWDADRYAVYVGEVVKDSSSVEELDAGNIPIEKDVSFFGATWPVSVFVDSGRPLVLDVPEGVSKCRLHGYADGGNARIGLSGANGDEMVKSLRGSTATEFNIDIPLNGATQIVINMESREGCVYVVEVKWDEEAPVRGVWDNPELDGSSKTN